MAYTDRQMKDATQVAYMQCFPEAEKTLVESGKKKPFTVRELIEASFNINDAKLKAIESGYIPEAMSFKELVKFSSLPEEDIERISLFQDETLNWKVVDIHDKNAESGFYACTLETSDSEAIIAFRGSESYGLNVIHDWLFADFGLLNSTKTNQQAETEKYADELIKRGIIDKYDFLAATGHSLGGNLATHLNIISAIPGREKLYDKLKQVVNMDGPGMSHDYIKKYIEQIARTSTKLSHYKWSTIGNLLFDIPGEKRKYLYSNEKIHADKNEIQRAFWRHDTRTICFDENGQAQEGEQDKLSKILGPVSRLVDKVALRAIMAILGEKGLGTIGSVEALKDLISINGYSEKGKKSAALDVLGATFKDKEINKTSVNEVTKFFNNVKDKFFGLGNDNKTDVMVRA